MPSNSHSRPGSPQAALSPPILTAGSNQKWDVVLGLVIGIGCLVAAAGFWRDMFPVSPALVLLGGALIIGCSILWVVRRTRRAWTILHSDGFTLQDGRGEEEFRDEDVFAMSLSTKKNYNNGVYHSTTRVFTTWVEDSVGPRKIVMTTKLKGTDVDFLAPLVSRIAERLREEANRTLEDGHPVEGKGWKLEEETLFVTVKGGQETIPLSEVTAADIYDRHVCVWRRGTDEPVARFPDSGENAWILLLLLQERAAKQATGDATAGGLGRILFERKAARFWAWIGYPLAALALLIGAILVIAAIAERKPVLILFAFLFGGLGLLLGVGTAASRRAIFRCHEYGVHSVRWFRERRLRYTDVIAFTCTATRVYVNGAYSGTQIALTFEPAPEADSGTIKYSANVHNADDEIDMLRDHVSRVVAGRMARDLAARKPVRWLDHLTFENDGLSYRPSGFLGRKEPIFLNYGDLERYSVDDGQFKLWLRGQPKPTVNENVAQRNFFPGFMLLLMVLSTPPAAAQEQATEPMWN